MGADFEPESRTRPVRSREADAGVVREFSYGILTITFRDEITGLENSRFAVRVCLCRTALLTARFRV